MLSEIDKMRSFKENKDREINPFDEIIFMLDANHVGYQTIKHEPVYTSAQAESISGLALNQGAKALLLKADKDFVLVVLPGDKRVDCNKLKQVLAAKKVRFAGEEEVRKIMHCELGACYPIGSFLNLRTVADPSLIEHETIAFNPGVNDKSIILKSEDYIKVASPEIIQISE